MPISISMSTHALQRELQRGVSRQEIADVVNAPVETRPAAGSGKLRFFGPVRDDGRRLCVVATHPPRRNRVKIVTCYFEEGSPR